MHPYLPYAELIQRYSPLADYLGEALERSVVVRIGRNYHEHIVHIGKNRVDIAFGDPESTMSHLVPRFMLWRVGVTGEVLADYQFLSNHTNVALGVLVGDFDAGAVKEEVFYEFEPKGLKP